MATFERRGKRWRAVVCVNRVRKSATFATKQEALMWALDAERRLGRADTGATFGDALERYRDEVTPHKKGRRWESIRIDLILRDRLARVPLSELSPSDIAGWRDRRLREVSSGSVIREMAIIRHCCTTAHREWGWLHENPAEAVKKPKSPPARTRRITEDEIERICLALGYDGGQPTETRHHVALAFLFAIETAMRAGEILSIRPGNIDMRGRFVRLVDTKNGEGRDVPLSDRAAEILRLVGGQFKVSSATLDAQFRRARDAAQITGLRFHDTRREATSRLARKLNPLELARVTGHKDLKMLLVYYQESASDIAKRL